jgi:Flp pilus assembly protein TadD
MCQLLPLVNQERDPTDQLRHLLRSHLSLVANDLGVALKDLGHEEDAYSAFRQALRLESGNLSAKLNRAMLVRDGAHPDERAEIEASAKEALAAFKRQTTTFEIVRTYGQVRSPEALASVGESWARLGQYGLAQGAMARAAALAKDDRHRAAILTSLGGIKLTVRDTAQGENVFRTLLKSSPRTPFALLGMLDLALLRGNPADARNWLDNARTSGADATALILAEARIEIAERNYAACCTRLLELTDREPKNLQAWTLLAAAMIQQGRGADAELQVLPRMESVTEKKGHPLVFQVRGAIARTKGPAAYGVARDAYRNALAMLPGRRDLLEVILDLDLAMGDVASAGKDAGDLLRADREHPLAHYVLGTQAAACGDLDTAEWHLRQSVRSDAAAASWNNLADLLRQKGSLGEAEESARQAVAKAGDNAAFLDTLAAVLLERGKISEANEVVGRAFALAPDDWQVSLTVARAWMQAGKIEEARVLLRKIQGHLEELPPSTRKEVLRVAQLWSSRL